MDDGQRCWRSPTSGVMDMEGVAARIVRFMSDNGSGEYRLMIGTDSKAINGSPVSLATAVALVRVGSGGIFFIWRSRPRKFGSLAERIRAEADQSIRVAIALRTLLRECGSDQPVDEIHLDIGDNGPTQEFIQALVTQVNGSGHSARYKPNAPAASRVAHRYA